MRAKFIVAALLCGVSVISKNAQAIGIPLILGPGGLIGGGALILPSAIVGSLANGYPLIHYGPPDLLPEPGFDGAPIISPTGSEPPSFATPENQSPPANSFAGEKATCAPGTDLRNGAVFTAANSQPENQLIAYARYADGTLCRVGEFLTGGASDPLAADDGGQSVAAAHENYALVINPGSTDGAHETGSLSVFRIEADRLVLTDVESTGAAHPRSVTRHGDRVYVVNAGVSSDTSGRSSAGFSERVRGYRLDVLNGNLSLLPGSDMPTLDPQGDPAWIQFAPEGDRLLIFQRRSIAESGAGVRRYVEVMHMGAHDVPTAVTRYETHSEPLPGPSVRTDVLLSGAPHSVSTANDVDACWNYVSRITAVSYLYTPALPGSAIGPFSIQAEGSRAPIIPHPAFASRLEDPTPSSKAGGRNLHGVVDMSGREYLYVLDSPLKPFDSYEARITGFSIHPADGNLAIVDTLNGLPGSTFGLWAF